MDNDPEVLHDGIRQIYVLDWLVKRLFLRFFASHHFGSSINHHELMQLGGFDRFPYDVAVGISANLG